MPDTKSKGSPGNVNLETHPLVAKLHADPDELTDLVALAGYLGPSKRKDYVRLYVDLTFRNYYEIPKAGIVSTSPTDASDENSPTTVHVAGGAQVDKVSVTSQSAEARFLQGSISSGYLGGAGAGAQADVAGWPASPTCWCTSHTCVQGAARVGQVFTDTVYHSCACTSGENTCNTYAPVCVQAGAQAQAEPWPASPTCWCNITRNCGQAGARAAPQYLSYVCSYVHCGQAGAGEVGCSWPASPTCWCFHTQQGCT